ncbi:DUF7619 domain-containing protein [Novipirellula caenicola]|uniref:DUF7619 domain-containing protein n=1 Tax=Novipirellula caenicola TaxID=1536901 RepID=A0ABP9VYU2_9BACT
MRSFCKKTFAKRRQRRLHVERLEHRTLLAAFIWNTDQSGSWHDPSNWSGGVGVPGVNDTVTIDRGDANPVITITSDIRIESLQTSESIILSAGMHVDGHAQFLAGAVQWTSGWLRTDNVSIESDASLQISGAETKQFSGTLINRGSVFQHSALHFPLNNTTLDNGPLGMWQMDGPFMSDTSRSIVFSNEGTIEKVGENTTAFLDAHRLDHRDGSQLVVHEGTLALGRSGTSTNPSTGVNITVAENAKVVLQPVQAYWSGRFSGDGDGRIEFADGLIHARDEGVTLDFSEDVFHWIGGDTYGSWTNLGSITIDEPTEKRPFGGLQNHGRVTMLSGSQFNSSSAGISNASDGVWEMMGTAQLGGQTFHDAVFYNEGLLLKTGAGTAGIVDGGVSIVHLGGTIQIDAGDVVAAHHSSYLSEGGVFSVADGSTLRMQGSWKTTGRYAGDGGGKVVMEARLQSSSRDMVLDFPADFFYWSTTDQAQSSGWIINEGHVTFENPQESIQIIATLVNEGTILQTSGTQLQLRNFSTTINRGNWEIQDDTVLDFHQFDGLAASFFNFGSLTKTGDAQSRFVSAGNQSRFHNNGLVEIQGGDLRLQGDIVANVDANQGRLFGGRWIVQSDASLDIVDRDGQTIPLSTNEAAVSLEGAAASFPAIRTVQRNGGRLVLRNGESLRADADFINGMPRSSAAILHRGATLNIRTVGIAVDPSSGLLITHTRNERVNGEPVFRVLNDRSQPAGDVIIQPGGAVDRAGIDITTQPMAIGNTTVPAGTLLFIHSDLETPTVFAIEIASGQVLATVEIPGLPSGQRGIAEHPGRGTLFLLGGDSQIREIASASGQIQNEFSARPTGSTLSAVTWGGIEVDADTGNLWVVGDSGRVHVLSATGELVYEIEIQFAAGATIGLSDITHDDETGQTWVSTESGELFLLGVPAVGTFGSLELSSDVDVIVAGDFTNTGWLDLAVGGRPHADRFSEIIIDGNATLGGTLQLRFDQPFVSEATDPYPVLQYAGRDAGAFDDVYAGGFEVVSETTRVVAFADRAPVIDLVATAVDGPTVAVANGQATLTYQVVNLGNDVATGPWYDEVRLIASEASNGEDDIDPVVYQELIVGGGNVAEGITIAPGQSHSFSLTVDVPGVLPGSYRWIVDPNRRGDLIEVGGRGNNSGTSESVVRLEVPELRNDGTPIAATFPREDHPLWYQIVVPAEAEVDVMLTIPAAGMTVTELYAAPDYIPNRVNFVARHQQSGQKDSLMTLTGGEQDQVWYIAALPGSFDSAAAEFELVANVLPLRINNVAPSNVGHSGEATLQIRGARLSKNLTYQLIDADGNRRTAVRTHAIDRTSATATFELGGLHPGDYAVVASDGNVDLFTLANAVTVEPTKPDRLITQVRGSTRVRSGRTLSYEVHVTNESNVDVPMPFITARVDGGGELQVAYDSVHSAEELFLFPGNVIPGASVIPAGGFVSLPIYYQAPLDEGEFTITAWVNSVNDTDFASTPLDWDRVANGLRPDGNSEASWNAFVARERARYGETFADFYAFLSAQANDLDAKGFIRSVFVNGQWQFDLPASDPANNAIRGIFDESDSLAEQFALAIGNNPRGQGEETGGGDSRQDVYAVVVGNPDKTLPGAELDAESWSSFFSKTLNLDTGNTAENDIIVQTRGTTADEFLSNIEATKAKADEDDLLVVIYAGHSECRLNKQGNSIVGGDILLSKGTRLSGSQLDSALAGKTKTIALFDSCRSGAVASEITSANITTIAGADASRNVQDEASLSRHLVPLLVKNPSGNLLTSLETASDQMFAAGIRYASPEQQKMLMKVNQLLRPNGIASDPNKTPAQVRQEFNDLFLSSPIDLDGDGKYDYFAFDTDLDGRSDTTVPDVNGNGELDRGDYPRSEKKFEDLEPAQQASFDEFERLREFESLKRNLGSAAFPELDTSETSISFDNVDPKKGGGGGEEGGEDGGDGGKDKDSLTNQTSEEQKDRGPGDKIRGERGRSFDPNEKVGPAGAGSRGFLADARNMNFQIFFENDPERGSLPAQEVFVTEVLDEDLDLSTFALGDMVVGDRVFKVPEGRSYWTTTEPIVVDGYPIDLSIEAELDFITRTVSWTFASLDPATGVLTNLFEAGFLPLNDETGRGEGHVSYRVSGYSGDATGTQYSGAAEIVFDVNEPIITNSTLNAIDRDAPVSSVANLPEKSLTRFEVSWSGDDGDGAGVVGYDIYVSTDGSEPSLWMSGTTTTSAIFHGNIGSTYSFYSMAMDAVRRREPLGAMPDATTLVAGGPWTNPLDRFDVDDRDGVTALDALLVINELSRRSVIDVDGRLPNSRSIELPPSYYDVNADGFATPLDALQVINQLGRIAPSSATQHDGEWASQLEVELQPETLPTAFDFHPSAQRFRSEIVFNELDRFGGDQQHRSRIHPFAVSENSPPKQVEANDDWFTQLGRPDAISVDLSAELDLLESITFDDSHLNR